MLLKFVILLLFHYFCISFANENVVSVRVKNGIINGRKETVDGKALNIFKGIPYAQPPIGKLRFKKPLPVQPWAEPFEADKWPNPCIQIPMQLDYYRNLNFSEDCLHLNIWSPANIDQGNENELKAVMFWIHGGAYYFGSGNEDCYNAEILAAKGDVVAVNINYRLNTLGFLYTGTDDAPGNAGLWDQALALEWVNDNIRYFGGDPNRITIFGESAGGWSVSLHILSPITRNLFQNAIPLSGAALTHLANENPRRALNQWLSGAKIIGCDDENSGDEFTEKIIECLLNADANELAKIPSLPELNPESLRWLAMPVIDGDFIPRRAFEMLEIGDHKKNFNLLVTTTSDEGSFILTYRYDHDKYDTKNPQNLSYHEAYDELKLLTSMIISDMPIDTEDVAKVYYTGISPNSDDYALLRRTIGIALGDFYLGCPTHHFAKMVFNNDRKGSKVYQAYYNSKLGEEKLICADWMGTCHANDLWPVFGICFRYPETCLDVEREESEQVIEYFSHFAKYGKPSKQRGVEWPEYYVVNDNVVAPYLNISNLGNERRFSFEYGLKIVECDYLWKKYIDKQ